MLPRPLPKITKTNASNTIINIFELMKVKQPSFCWNSSLKVAIELWTIFLRSFATNVYLAKIFASTDKFADTVCVQVLSSYQKYQWLHTIYGAIFVTNISKCTYFLTLIKNLSKSIMCCSILCLSKEIHALDVRKFAILGPFNFHELHSVDY